MIIVITSQMDEKKLMEISNHHCFTKIELIFGSTWKKQLKMLLYPLMLIIIKAAFVTRSKSQKTGNYMALLVASRSRRLYILYSSSFFLLSSDVFLMSRFCNFFGSLVVLTCSNSSQLIRTRAKLSQLVPTCPNLTQLAPTCPI